MYSASYSSKLFSFSYNNNNGSDGNKDGDDCEFNCDKGDGGHSDFDDRVDGERQ